MAEKAGGPPMLRVLDGGAECPAGERQIFRHRPHRPGAVALVRALTLHKPYVVDVDVFAGGRP